MLKMVAAGATVLFVAASLPVHAQSPSVGEPDHLTAADVGALTDARINIVKAALQLTPDQAKYWPAIEDAIRVRAQNRQARIADAMARVDELHNRSAFEILRDRNPVDFLNRRADALTQRGADLKRLADAWQPLYQTMTPDQKRRMALLTVFVLREMRNGMEQRRLESEDAYLE